MRPAGPGGLQDRNKRTGRQGRRHAGMQEGSKEGRKGEKERRKEGRRAGGQEGRKAGSNHTGRASVRVKDDPDSACRPTHRQDQADI